MLKDWRTWSRLRGFAVIIGAIGIGALGSPVAAATYFVDGPNVACTNAGAGTEVQPFCTITAALGGGRALGGNTFLVKPGIYREQVSIPASGSLGSPIVLQGTASGVVVDGSDDYTSSAQWALLSGDVWVASGVSWHPLQVFLDGVRIDSSAVEVSALPSRTFRWVPDSGLYVNAGGGSPAIHQARVGRRNYGFTLPARSFVTIDRFEVTRTEDRGIYLAASCNNVTLTHNTVTFANKMGIQAVGGSGLVIGSNLISDNNDFGIALISGVTASTIEDNESCRNARPGARIANGIYLFDSPRNTVRRNRLHHNQDTGLHIQSGSNDCVAYLNRSWNNGDHGFDHLESTGTIHVCDVAYGNYKDGFSIEGNASGTQLYDCIAVENGLTTNEFDLWIDLGSTPGFVSDYNLFWNSTLQPPVKYISTLYSKVSDYSAASGQDQKTLQVDPKFVNAPAGDFHLATGSPAIDNGNAGVPNWPTLDADGFARFDAPGVANAGTGRVAYSDRGAFEFGGIAKLLAAALAVTPATGNAPLAVTADASGSIAAGSTGVSYRFDFGDGTVVGPQSVALASHIYSAGNWTARVTVADSLGATSTASIPIIAAAVAPQANWIGNSSFETGLSGWGPYLAGTLLQVPGGFDGSSALQITGSAANNGNFGVDDVPNWITVTTGAVRYRFTAWVRSESSTGNLRLRVVENRGSTRVQTRETPNYRLSPAWQQATLDFVARAAGNTLDFQIYDRPRVSGEVFLVDNVSIVQPDAPPNVAPVARLTIIPSSGWAQLTFTADASASTDSDSPIASYRFDFGDGTIVGPQAGATASHTYSGGNWLCTVTVTDNGGLTDSTAVPVTASAKPRPGRGDLEPNAPVPNASAELPIKPVVAPNPIVGTSFLKFSTSRSGPLRVAIFDVSGRRVRTVLDDSQAAAGLHVLPLDDHGDGGARLESGIYFYRIRSADGLEMGRFLIMK
jgi:parallel beta-helix repeat protein